MKNQNIRRVSALATLLLCLGVANAEPSATVETRDLDLRKPQDVAALYSRIELRAAEVCKAAASPWDAARVSFVKKCTSGAVEDAVARANVGALTALHQSKVEAARIAQYREVL